MRKPRRKPRRAINRPAAWRMTPSEARLEIADELDCIRRSRAKLGVFVATVAMMKLEADRERRGIERAKKRLQRLRRDSSRRRPARAA